MSTFDAMKEAKKLMDDAFYKKINNNVWIDLETGKEVSIEVVKNNDGTVSFKGKTNENQYPTS